MTRQSPSGAIKRVSEPVYPDDILSDIELGRASLSARGAWLYCLCAMWRDRTDRVTGSLRDFACDWRCTESEAEQVIAELERCNVCEVTYATNCHNNVTLMSRRLARRENERKAARNRQKRSRTETSSRDCHGPVTAKKPLPSVSVSVSSPRNPPKAPPDKTDSEPPRFTPPDPSVVTEYAQSIDFDLDGSQFCDFYASKGWMIGRNRMKDWKAAVRTWKRADKKRSGKGKSLAELMADRETI